MIYHGGINTSNVIWTNFNTKAEITHKLNCIPIVALFDNNNNQLNNLNIHIDSPSGFTINFLADQTDIHTYFIINYGTQYGDPTVISNTLTTLVAQAEEAKTISVSASVVSVAAKFDAQQAAARCVQLQLAACSSLGQATTISGISLTWKDPENIVLNDSTIAEWNQTVLVQKEGSFPTDHNDGTVIGGTSRTAANKNYYYENAFHRTYPDQSKTYYYQLFSQTIAGTWNCLDANKYVPTVSLSWTLIRDYVRAGRGAELFPVGTVFVVDDPEYIHTNGDGIYFRVAGHDQVQPYDQTLQHSMCLQMTEGLFQAQYDAPEYLYALTEDSNFLAGKLYYTYVSGTVYQQAIEGTDYNIGDVVPLLTYYQKNRQDRANYGSNHPAQSNLLQWANSEEVADHVFTKKTLFDKFSTSYSGKNGFLRNIDSDFKNVLVDAKLLTALNTVCDGGGSTYVKAKMFPLSIGQVFNNKNIQEGQQLQYYVNGGSKVKCLMNSTTPIIWWLRSPNTDLATIVYNVASSGTQGNTNAFSANGVSLACIIA